MTSATSMRALPRTPLRAGLVQMQTQLGCVDRNLSVLLAFLTEAARKGCDLVLFPELSLCGYTIDRAEAAEAAIPEGQLADRLAPVTGSCRDTGATAVLSCILAEGPRLSIAAVAVDGSGIRSIYRKRNLHPPEAGTFLQGAQLGLFDIGDWRIGLGICFDGAHPAHAAELSSLGCHVYALSSLFGSTGGREESRAWLPLRAVANGMFALLSNHVGTVGSWTACGSAAAWSPTGELIAEADTVTQQMLVVTLDPSLAVPA